MIATAVRDKLTDRYRATIATAADQAAARIARVWDDLGGYDEADIATFARRIAPTIAGAKTVAVKSSTAFYSTLLAIAPPPIPDRLVAVTYDTRGPFTAVWHGLAESRPWVDAVAAGRSATEAATSDYVVSAARGTGDHVAARAGTKPRGWERVPGAGACDWCLTVAGNRYKSAETANFGHTRCDCSVVPIFE